MLISLKKLTSTFENSTPSVPLPFMHSILVIFFSKQLYVSTRKPFVTHELQTVSPKKKIDKLASMNFEWIQIW